MMEDIKIRCMNCGDMFLWLKFEQQRLKELLEDKCIKAIYPPKRCYDCRQKNKANFLAKGIVRKDQLPQDKQLADELNSMI